MTTFKEQYLAGKVEIEYLDACAKEWHAGRAAGDFITYHDAINGVFLWDYLGLAKEEFALLLQGGLSLLQKDLDKKRG